MFKKFLSFLVNRKKYIEKSNYIIFEIDQIGNISPKLEINDKSLKSADKYGLLLFLMNEGYYVQTFLDLLSDLTKQGDIETKFTQKVINSWSIKVNETNNYENSLIEIPIIKPTQFSNEK